MRRLSVENTPISIATRVPIQEAAPLLMASQSSDIIGRERFFKTPEIQARVKKALAKDSKNPALNPNVLRRSGCRCSDRYDSEPDPKKPRCKSRFCVRIRSGSQFGKKNSSERDTRRGLMVKLPGNSGLKISRPSSAMPEKQDRRAA